ncbi:2-hydroxy-3-oxopropionate reductase [Gracilibacillus salitolerans]|uniref:2-hydroxy-3-oxopropionate reductase n=1 Tax=Gracilibacillus salitolerans TaxID=2663022 RepID=A0A5Q2TLV0_9BACI|nr:2-hydroxy-3-oxopropionate reductase [Gracilibacillus salitolerans]QGH35949.1 2-hydroxy-3-oxopropionate reductase [Gracilibacillus salitolerans]
MERVGFIGLGIMGKPMAKNIMKSGYDLVVYNRSQTSVQELIKEGAEAAQSPKEVAQKVDVLVTMLPDSPDVKKVLLGVDGAIEGLSKGKMVIDMSSISPIVARELDVTLQDKGIRMMDAPVSGGESGAIEGTLAIMVGANESDYELYRKLLLAMGKSVHRVGDVGSGNVAKLVNQSIVALNIAAISEAFLLGAKSGVDPRSIYEAISGGLAGSNALNAKFPMMTDNNFMAGFTLELHKKDLDNVLKNAQSLNVEMPLTSMVTEFVEDLIKSGEAKSDHSALLKYFENLSSSKLIR